MAVGIQHLAGVPFAAEGTAGVDLATRIARHLQAIQHDGIGADIVVVVEFVVVSALDGCSEAVAVGVS